MSNREWKCDFLNLGFIGILTADHIEFHPQDYLFEPVRSPSHYEFCKEFRGGHDVFITLEGRPETYHVLHIESHKIRIAPVSETELRKNPNINFFSKLEQYFEIADLHDRLQQLKALAEDPRLQRRYQNAVWGAIEGTIEEIKGLKMERKA